MTGKSVQARADRVAKLIEEKLGIRGEGLEAKLRRAGRLLPRYVRREGAALTEALSRAGNPKLERMIDDTRLEKAEQVFVRYLGYVDPWERRKTRLLDLLSANALIAVVVATAVIAVLVWRGFL